MLSTDTSTATGVLTSSTQTITLGFYFMANTDLVVTRTRSGVITTLTLDGDYSVVGAGNESGGSITVTGQASGDVITIERTVDYKQISDYIPLTKLSATTIERDFDRCAMRDQQIVRRVKSLEDTPSIGIEEAPLDGTPYARQDGDWTPLSGGGDMLKSTYDTANRGYVDRAVLADTATTATTAGTITGQGDAATKNVGTTAGTVAAGDDSRIVAGGTALQPTGSGASLTGITASQVGAATAAQGATADNTASALTSHTGNTSNPHAVTKAQVGLGNVDNTSDANKPVSTAQATAITAQVFADVALTNPYSATPALTPRRVGDRAYNTTSLEWWDGIATAGATTSWQLAASGGGGSGDMTKAVYDTVNRGYVDRAVLADTATTSAALTGNISESQVTDLTTHLAAKASTISYLRSKRPHGVITTTAAGNLTLADWGKNHIVNVGKDGIELLLPIITAPSVAGTQYQIATLAGEAGTSGWAVKTVDGVLYFGRGIASGPEWCNTGVTLAASSFYEIRIKWVATSTDFTLVINGTAVTSGMTNNLTTAAWVDCTNKLYFGCDASGANNVAVGFTFLDRPELYNYAFTTDQWNTWLSTDIAPTTGYGTMNAVPNYDFLDGSNDWVVNNYTTSVTGGVLSFTCTVASPVAYAAYIRGTPSLFAFDPSLTYTATARVRWASGTTGGTVGFGSSWAAVTALVVNVDDTSWKTITTTFTPTASPLGVYGSTTTATWELDYLIISRSGNVLEGLEFSAQPLQAHAANGAFWTLSNAEPWPYTSARTATLKTPAVITADGVSGITMPANWRPLAFTVRNSGTTNSTGVIVRQSSTSGIAYSAGAAPNAHQVIIPSVPNGVVLIRYTSIPTYATGLVTGNRIWVDMQICR